MIRNIGQRFVFFLCQFSFHFQPQADHLSNFDTDDLKAMLVPVEKDLEVLEKEARSLQGQVKMSSINLIIITPSYTVM